MRRETPLVAAGLLALLALWFWPLLLGDQLGQSYNLWFEHPWAALRPPGIPAINSGEGDAAVVFHPLLEAARAQVHDGRFPAWNPWSYAGMPLHGDIQTGLLYPLTWLALLLPVAQAWGPIAIGKLLVAGIGTWVLGRELGLDRGPALVAALAFMLCAPNLAWLQWPLTTVFALLPWLLWATERQYGEPTRRHLALLALVVGLSILAGHPETALLSSSATGVYLLVRGRDLRALGRWAAGHALGALLAAAALVPFLEAYRVSITRAEHGAFAELSMPPEAALLWALPNVFGDGTPNYVGPLRTYVTTAAFFGVAALLLALVALVRLRREPVALGLAAMAACALGVVFAIPPVNWITRNVPPFATGNNLRVLHIVALAGALGAGAGVQLLQRRALSLRAVAGWVGGAAALVAIWLAVAAAASRLPAPRSTEVAAVVRYVLSLAVAGGCLILLGRVRWATALVALVVVAELAYMRGFNVTLPPEKAYPPRPPAVAALQANVGDGRISVLRPGPFEPLLQPNTAALYGLEAIQGYDYPQPKRWADFSWFVLNERGPSREIILSSPPVRGASLTGLRLMNTRLYIGPPGARSPHPDLRPVYRGRDGTVFEDPQALPRAYVVGTVRRVGDAAALALLRRGALDPRAEALVPPGAPQPPPAPAPFRPASARRLSEEHWRVDVPRGGGGWLVVANAFGPQWRAEVDGRPAKLFPTDFAALGLPLPAGARRVELTVSHRSLHWGLALSALAIVLLAGLDAEAAVTDLRYDGIDSLRAFAALSVFGFHLLLQPGFTPPQWLIPYAANLNVGVSVFFVISGFVIYRPFVRARLRGEPGPPLRRYAVRRTARIVPAYWVALALIALWLGLDYVFTPTGIVTYFGFLQVYDPDTTVNGIGQAWSLCIEVTFYVGIALLAVLWRARSLRGEVALTGALVLVTVLWRLAPFYEVPTFGQLPDPATLTLPAYADELALGMLLAALTVVRPLRIPGWSGWVLAAVAFVGAGVLTDTGASESQVGNLAHHMLFGLVGVGLVLPAITGAPRWLLHPALRWAGLVSFGFYLWHLAVLHQLTDAGWRGKIGAIGYLALALALSVGLAAASWYAIERPALRLARRARWATPRTPPREGALR